MPADIGPPKLDKRRNDRLQVLRRLQAAGEQDKAVAGTVAQSHLCQARGVAYRPEHGIGREVRHGHFIRGQLVQADMSRLENSESVRTTAARRTVTRVSARIRCNSAGG